MILVRKVLPISEDERGSIYDLVEKDVGHVGMIRSKQGTVRGNHYHIKQTQYTYVVSGELEYVQRGVRNNESPRESMILHPGDLVETPPFVAHRVTFLKDSLIIDVTTKRRELGKFEEDTIRIDV